MKPIKCPFCASENLATSTKLMQEGQPGWEARVECKGCGAQGPRRTALHMNEATGRSVKAWNNRSS